MVDFLVAYPLVALMAVVALGAAVGRIPFGPLRFGAAGALFVGLAIGALDPRLGEGFALVQSIGLILFVYGVGIAAGETFFADLRKQLPLMVLAVVVVFVAGGAALAVGSVLGVTPGLVAGVFAGSLTSTPALAAATEATGSPDAAVGYSIGYPVGVILAILVVALVVGRRWPARRDPEPESNEGLLACSVTVDRHVPLHKMPGWTDETVKISYLERDGRTSVIYPGQDLLEGDVVVLVGARAAVERAAAAIGHRDERDLTEDRSDVDFRRFTLSQEELVGKTVAQLDLPGRFGGVVTRVRRGDTELLARDSLTLQPGDRVLAVVPRHQFDAVAQFLGDSERKVSEFDSLGFGLGIVLGLLVGTITLPLPGGGAFSLGSAAGPLVVGMVLGALKSSGPVTWTMPLSVNLTVRQLGLLLFLAAVGLASGPQFASQAFTPLGLRTGALAAVIVLVSAGLLLGGARLMGLSTPRSAGAFAGYVGQPAILSFAEARVRDERIEAGYAALFALCIVAKIIAVHLMGAVL